MSLTPAQDAAFEASWPAAEYASAGAIRIGRRAGGGDRVSAARPTTPDWTEGDIARAIEIQTAWGQPASFRLAEDDSLAGLLLARGWRAQKPTRFMSTPIPRLTDQPVPRVTAFAVWPPLAIQRELWAEQGIGPARQAIMDRVQLPKAAILGRAEDRAAGVAFVAVSNGIAVLHALEVLPVMRRKGSAGWMLREAAFWAAAQGAEQMLLAVTAGNSAALALYRGLGFTDIGGYSYYSP